jgi:hypothetical protein
MGGVGAQENEFQQSSEQFLGQVERTGPVY